MVIIYVQINFVILLEILNKKEENESRYIDYVRDLKLYVNCLVGELKKFQ